MDKNLCNSRQIAKKCNRDNKRYKRYQIQLLFIFAYFAYLVGNRLQYPNCIINAHYQIVYKGCDADIFFQRVIDKQTLPGKQHILYLKLFSYLYKPVVGELLFYKVHTKYIFCLEHFYLNYRVFSWNNTQNKGLTNTTSSFVYKRTFI